MITWPRIISWKNEQRDLFIHYRVTSHDRTGEVGRAAAGGRGEQRTSNARGLSNMAASPSWNDRSRFPVTNFLTAHNQTARPNHNPHDSVRFSLPFHRRVQSGEYTDQSSRIISIITWKTSRDPHLPTYPFVLQFFVVRQKRSACKTCTTTPVIQCE